MRVNRNGYINFGCVFAMRVLRLALAIGFVLLVFWVSVGAAEYVTITLYLTHQTSSHPYRMAK
jgi:hypothetical protein